MAQSVCRWQAASRPVPACSLFHAFVSVNTHVLFHGELNWLQPTEALVKAFKKR